MNITPISPISAIYPVSMSARGLADERVFSVPADGRTATAAGGAARTVGSTAAGSSARAVGSSAAASRDDTAKRLEKLGIKDPAYEARKKADPVQRKLEENDPQTKAKKAMGLEECETCKNRKYVDGSDEMVSFKSPTHVSPEAAAGAVMAHEQEHVSNAYSKAAKAGGEVVQASVAIHTAVCPECGRTYVSGGTTTTQIKYYNEDNPYQQDLKSADRLKYSGANVDARV